MGRLIKLAVVLALLLTRPAYSALGQKLSPIPTDSLSVVIDIPDTLDKKADGTPILLHITNKSSKPIVIRNPQYWGNAIPDITLNGADIPLGIRVKPWPGCKNETITLNPKETKTVKYGHSLEPLFYGNCESGRYNLSFILQLDEDTEIKTMPTPIYVNDGCKEDRYKYAYKKFSQIPDSIIITLDQMGLDNSDTLTELECKYLMYRKPPLDSTFTYCGKKIAFTYFTYLHKKLRLSRKLSFFMSERMWVREGDTNDTHLTVYYFDETIKKKYKLEYDVIVGESWSKITCSTEKAAKKYSKFLRRQKRKSHKR